jgi:hypothetical protein
VDWRYKDKGAISMKIHIPTSNEQRYVVATSIEDVEFFIVRRSGKLLKFDYWLGSSQDGSVWALYETTRESLSEDDDFAITSEHLVCWLTDPPKRNREVIGTILFQVQADLHEAAVLPENRLNEIIESNPFPVYKRLAELLPGGPKHWLDLPVEIEVSFQMSDGACVYYELYSEYKRTSLEEVVKTVFEPRLPGILFHYSLKTKGATPLTPYEVDWAFSRKGKQVPYKRGKVTRDTPWSQETDTTLIKVYQWAPRYGFGALPGYWSKPTVRLTVAGRTAEESIANWYIVAKSLRKMKETSCQ